MQTYCVSTVKYRYFTFAFLKGTKLCEVYDAGVALLKKEKPELSDRLTKSFG